MGIKSKTVHESTCTHCGRVEYVIARANGYKYQPSGWVETHNLPIHDTNMVSGYSYKTMLLCTDCFQDLMAWCEGASTLSLQQAKLPALTAEKSLSQLFEG